MATSKAGKSSPKKAKAPAVTKTGVPSVASLRAMAKDNGVSGYSKMKKDDLIRAIQTAEGNAPCYGRIPDCGVPDCLWRPECLPGQ